MRAIHTIMRTLALAAVLLPLASCVQKEVQLPALSQPGNISYDADFGSLSLTWAPVDNAAQYYYKLENALGYTVAKGTTRNTYVTVGSLQPATTYTVRIKAIPAGVDAKTYAASDFYVTEATTAAPKSYDFEWSYPATIWWYYDTDVYHETKGKTTFGYDKTLQAYVIQAWGGVMGMDIVFTLSDSGEWLINYAESTAYTGGPDGNMVVGLAHGIIPAVPWSSAPRAAAAMPGCTIRTATGRAIAWNSANTRRIRRHRSSRRPMRRNPGPRTVRPISRVKNWARCPSRSTLPRASTPSKVGTAWKAMASLSPATPKPVSGR